jgi:hypothetical protein
MVESESGYMEKAMDDGGFGERCDVMCIDAGLIRLTFLYSEVSGCF